MDGSEPDHAESNQGVQPQNRHVRSTLFGDIAQGRVVIPYEV